MSIPFIWRLYRPFMRLAHRYNWHHTTVCYPEGDTLFWCEWCGMRRRDYKPVIWTEQQSSGKGDK